MRTLENLSQQLCQVSRDNMIDVFSSLEWPDQLPESAWFISPEMLSLYGTPLASRLDEVELKRLSFFEAVNFFSLNIHGEKILIEGLAKRLYRRSKGVVAEYLHHFIDEENKHMYYFGRFCEQYGGKIYPDRKLSVPRDFAKGEEDVIFFANVLIFEEIVDVYNRTSARDDRVEPLSREINRLHHYEESRHLAFGRKMLRDTYEAYAPHWDDEVHKRVRIALEDFLVATWHEYYNPAVYADMGWEDAYVLRREVFESQSARDHRYRVSHGVVKILQDIGLFTEAPKL